MSGELRDLLPHVRLEELYPEWSTEVDRRIMASEVRIKFWIVGGVLTNLLVAISAAVPLIFYVGQITQSIQQTSSSLKVQTDKLDTNAEWVRERMIWEARVESALERQGVDIARNGK